MIEQFISDNSNSPFPVLLPTERLDRSVYALLNGGIVILTDGSPYALAGPATLLDFFVSPEDYYLPWMAGSFLRLVRFLGGILSIFISYLYSCINVSLSNDSSRFTRPYYLFQSQRTISTCFGGTF